MMFVDGVKTKGFTAPGGVRVAIEQLEIHAAWMIDTRDYPLAWLMPTEPRGMLADDAIQVVQRERCAREFPRPTYEPWLDALEAAARLREGWLPPGWAVWPTC